MSDTPDTDKAVMTFDQVSVNLPHPDFELVTADFARQLERRAFTAERDLDLLRYRCRQLLEHQGHLAADVVLERISEMLPANNRDHEPCEIRNNQPDKSR